MSGIRVNNFYNKKRFKTDNGEQGIVNVIYVPDPELSEFSESESESYDENTDIVKPVYCESNNEVDFVIESENESTESESESRNESTSETETFDNESIRSHKSKSKGNQKIVQKNVITKQNGRRGSKNDYRWRKQSPHNVDSSFKGEEFKKTPHLEWSPRQYFNEFFNAALFKVIADQTNLYSVQITGKSINTNCDEIEQFVGILITMGVLKYPQYRMYWSQHTKCASIAEVMALKRFELLKKYFHANDNTHMPKKGTAEYDHLYKVRPIVQSVLDMCRLVEQEECQSIDEQIIPTKSRCPIRQYLPKKPHKWGIKVWPRCGVSGLLYDFTIYLGKEENTDISKEYGKVGAAVLKLVTHLPKNIGHKIFMDNLFTSIKLFNTLKDLGIWAVGTIRNNRLHGTEKVMFKKKELEKMGRGSLDYRVDFNSNITVIRWMDNGVVQLASTFIGPSLGDPINRWSSKDKVVVKVSCPDMIHQYNMHMGGVDLCDMLMALYRIKLGTKKWYIHIIYYCINVAIVNGWILYKRHCKQNGYTRKNIIQLLEFQTRIADSLLREKKVSRGRPRSDTPVVKKKRCAVNAPAREICLDNVGHLPNFSEKQQRCKHCKSGYSRIFCEKCQVHLCLVTSRNCFYSFHS